MRALLLVALIVCTAFARKLSIKQRYESLPLTKHSRALAAPPGTELWFTNKVDHYDAANTDTFQQRYYINDTFYGGKPFPIFVMLGGEGAEKPTSVSGRYIANEYAQAFRALIVSVEHRYYGQSFPPNDLKSMRNLLTSQQAIADFADFIKFIVRTYGVSQEDSPLSFTKVVTFGGSYSGSLSAYMRNKYPEVVFASIASSAPVLAKENFVEYLNHVGQQVGTECSAQIKKGITYIEEQLKTEEGRIKLQTDFAGCGKIDSELDKSVFVESVTDSIASFVQYNGDNNGMLPFGIQGMCDILLSEDITISYPKFIKKYNEIFKQDCTETSYTDMIADLKNEDKNSASAAGRSWTWQTCNEFGYFQTAGDASPFSKIHTTLEFFEQICADAYGVDAQYTRNAVDNTNVYYQGLTPKSTNVYFGNGDVDPWSELGIVTPNTESNLPAKLIKGTAHCADLYRTSADDLIDLKACRDEQYRFLYDLLRK